MNSPRHLSWDNFKSSVFVNGQQRVHRVVSVPLIEIFGDGVSNRIGVWLESKPTVTIPPEMSKLSFITTRRLKRKGKDLLEIATSTSALQRQFYHFATAVAERIAVEHTPAIDAAMLELQCFADLLEQRSLLGTERQLGMMGELIFLERLAFKNPAQALDAWLGPLGEPHDFRVKLSEFEVKTTTSPQRIHTINGIEQLIPSKGCSLFLASVQLGPAGAGSGFSLADKVAAVAKIFAPTPALVQRFNTALESCGLPQTDTAHYTRRYVLRHPLALVPVDKNFPAISRPLIQKALGTLATRIESLQYDVNVQGLEHEDGTPFFSRLIP